MARFNQPITLVVPFGKKFSAVVKGGKFVSSDNTSLEVRSLNVPLKSAVTLTGWCIMDSSGVPRCLVSDFHGHSAPEKLSDRRALLASWNLPLTPEFPVRCLPSLSEIKKWVTGMPFKVKGTITFEDSNINESYIQNLPDDSKVVVVEGIDIVETAKGVFKANVNLSEEVIVNGNKLKVVKEVSYLSLKNKSIGLGSRVVVSTLGITNLDTKSITLPSRCPNCKRKLDFKMAGLVCRTCSGGNK